MTPNEEIKASVPDDTRRVMLMTAPPPTRRHSSSTLRIFLVLSAILLSRTDWSMRGNLCTSRGVHVPTFSHRAWSASLSGSHHRELRLAAVVQSWTKGRYDLRACDREQRLHVWCQRGLIECEKVSSEWLITPNEKGLVLCVILLLGQQRRRKF